MSSEYIHPTYQVRGLVHDLSNVLTALDYKLSKALSGLPYHSFLHQNLSGIKNSSTQACNLLKNLKDVLSHRKSQSESGQISTILKETIDSSVTSNNIVCESSIPDDLWQVCPTNTETSRIANNLMVNAFQAMPQGGKVQVRAKNTVVSDSFTLPLRPGRYVEIHVQDQGQGIPEEHIPCIFDPSFTTKENGTGLGLANVFSIVKSYEGYISVDSILGKGTVFQVFLPAKDQEPNRQASGLAAAVNTK